MGDENGGDRREIDKLRAQLEEQRFKSLTELIDTRFDRVDEKLDDQGEAIEKIEKKLNEHINSPHNLAAVAAAAAAVPPIQSDEQGFWRTIVKYWKVIVLILGFGGVGTGGYAFRGCGALAGTEIHLHNIAEMTASAVSNPVPTPTKGSN